MMKVQTFKSQLVRSDFLVGIKIRTVLFCSGRFSSSLPKCPGMNQRTEHGAYCPNTSTARPERGDKPTDSESLPAVITSSRGNGGGPLSSSLVTPFTSWPEFTEMDIL